VGRSVTPEEPKGLNLKKDQKVIKSSSKGMISKPRTHRSPVGRTMEGSSVGKGTGKIDTRKEKKVREEKGDIIPNRKKSLQNRWRNHPVEKGWVRILIKKKEC